MKLSPKNSSLLIRITSLLIIIFLGCVAVVAQEGAGSPPLTLRAGTVLTVRINQSLSSDRNQPGDLFTASLTQPVVVDGIVVAQSGQTVAGRVIDAKKAGKVSGNSQLAVSLTSITLVDGQHLPIQSQLLVQNGQPATGRDAAIVAGSTATGAMIGAAANWGKGAAIGTGVGAAAGIVGVLLTRGYATVIYPETPLAFQVTSPAMIRTDAAPQAFRFVEREDYPQQQVAQQQVPQELPPVQTVVAPAQAQVVYAAPYPYPYQYWGAYPYYAYSPYWGWPYWYGPGAAFYFRGPAYYRPYYYHPHPYPRPYPRPIGPRPGPVPHHNVVAPARGGYHR